MRVAKFTYEIKFRSSQILLHIRITWQREACPKFRSQGLSPRDSDFIGLGLYPGICVFNEHSDLFLTVEDLQATLLEKMSSYMYT